MVLDFIRTAYQFWLGHKAPFELLGLAMTLCGILFAMLSIRDGRKLTKDLRSIFDHLTTKEIGAFPVYMAEIERLISEARESIFIATDFPGHGVRTVFAIPSFGDQATEYGFYTEESGLVQALLSVWARYVEHSHPLAGQPVAVAKAS